MRARVRGWLKKYAIQVNWGVSLLSAGLLIWAAIQWGVRADHLLSPCRTLKVPLGACNETPEWLQGSQFVVAIIGIAAAVLAALLAVRQAFLRERLQILKYVGWAMLGSAAGWFALYWYGRIKY